MRLWKLVATTIAVVAFIVTTNPDDIRRNVLIWREAPTPEWLTQLDTYRAIQIIAVLVLIGALAAHDLAAGYK